MVFILSLEGRINEAEAKAKVFRHSEYAHAQWKKNRVAIQGAESMVVRAGMKGSV